MMATKKTSIDNNDDEDDQSEQTTSSKVKHYKLLVPQALVGLVDAMSFMIVAPSLVFYVLQAGGTKEQYGIILSAFSFASFMFKPVLGYWCDKSGGKFRKPYLTSIGIAALGGLLYFVASAFTGRMAVALIFLGRLLGGCGAANNTLGFTYIAQVVPPEQMTRANAVLSMVRVFGMAAAPGLNVFLGGVDATVKLGSHSFAIDPLNSVGLVLVIGNTLGFIIMYTMLEEPPESTRPKKGVDDVDERSWHFWKNVLGLDILVPLVAIFGMNANFQLLETGLAPAANDIMGWQPVAISYVFGANSVLIFFVILLTFKLSAMGVKDATLMKVGCVSSTVGYTLMYLWWKRDITLMMFVLPVVFCISSYPFMGAPTRSLFTQAVANNEYLCEHQGTMQAILSMMASVAGFTAPGLIAAFVLRTPEEVAASNDQRELTAWALFAPLLSILTLVGVIYVQHRYVIEEEGAERVSITELQIDERLALLGNAGYDEEHFFHPRTEANRRASTMLMHIPQISFHQAAPRRRMRRHSSAF